MIFSHARIITHFENTVPGRIYKFGDSSGGGCSLIEAKKFQELTAVCGGALVR